MSKKNNSFNGFMPMFQGMMPSMPTMPVMPVMPVMPMMPPMSFPQNNAFPWCNNEGGSGDFTSSLKKFWQQTIDMQKSSIDNSKDQWTQFYDYMMDMQDTFTESLPDELPTLPGLPAVSPKDIMKGLKEFQDMAKEYFVKQADSVVDLSIKGQEKVCEKVCKVMDTIKKEKDEPAKKAKAAPVEAEVVEAPAE